MGHNLTKTSSVAESGSGSQGGIPAGGDCRKAIQPVPLDFCSAEDTCRVEGKAVAFPSCLTASDKSLGGVQGALFQRAALLGSRPTDGGAKPRRCF